LSCQLDWLRWWQLKLKDNDLLLIALQATIPTLNFIDKKLEKVNLDNVFKLIGQVKTNKYSNCSISATSISEITGIPRATSIRKLNTLVSLGFLVREEKNKRYSVNQSYEGRTKNIMSRDNVTFTIKTFSEYIAVIINSLIHNKL
jgi:predicted transcriptional regulator